MLVGCSLKPTQSRQLDEPEPGDLFDAPLATFSHPALLEPSLCESSCTSYPASKARGSKNRPQAPKKEIPNETASNKLVTAFAAAANTQESKLYVRNNLPKRESVTVFEASEEKEQDSQPQSSLTKEWRRIVAEQWKVVRSGNGDKQGEVIDEDLAKSDAIKAATSHKHEDSTAQKKASFFKWPKKNGNAAKTESPDEVADAKKDKKDGNSNYVALVPQTFEDMAKFNAAMIGSNMSWISIAIDAFDQLVASVVNVEERRLEKETRILALRMNREAQGSVYLNEFKVCMLASLRSLLPKIWDLESEGAWSAMWDSVREHLEPMLPLPKQYAKPVEKFFSDLDAKEMRHLGMKVFERMFKLEPKSEDYFLQSNDRLCFIVQRAFGFSTEIYQDPKQTVDAITHLGLKHIMYGIPEKYFEPFVACCLEELSCRCEDPNTIRGFDWSMRLVQSIMVQAIEDGSNPLLKAVIANNPKQVRRELAKFPRGKRAAAALGGM
mmetsp:Transcript_52673/g.83571  ORF Transcript_52673/g.83571 Transcript_52673/m.83571 type:complete len:495 (+) Transcript_52673:108-1592(+)